MRTGPVNLWKVAKPMVPKRCFTSLGTRNKVSDMVGLVIAVMGRPHKKVIGSYPGGKYLIRPLELQVGSALRGNR